MATDKVILRDNKKAGEDLHLKQFFLVKITSSNTLTLAGSADRAYVLDSTPKENESGTYILVGITKVKLSGTVACGELVVPAAGGTGVAASGKSQPVVGQALEKGESGQIISVFATTGATA